MRKLTALALALAFAGVTSAQQAQSGSSQGQYSTGGPKHHKEWCRTKLGKMQADEIREAFCEKRVLGKEPKL
ncbi:hypothetical protein [Thermocrinis sp.]|jgi:Spy/CpxP family protein refolding chaperone|uniref:hypothetical protein n=1 Tax=Thermocrinis sp. TaxID=2024383 RepID=UPI003C0692ED